MRNGFKEIAGTSKSRATFWCQAVTAMALMTHFQFLSGQSISARGNDTLPTEIRIPSHRYVKEKPGTAEHLVVNIGNFPIPDFALHAEYWTTGLIDFYVQVDTSDFVVPGKNAVIVMRFQGTKLIKGQPEKGIQSRYQIEHGQIIPICGHVYRFERVKDGGILTLEKGHELNFDAVDKKRFFSVSNWLSFGIYSSISASKVRENNVDQVIGLGVVRIETSQMNPTEAVVRIMCGDNKHSDVTSNLDDSLISPLPKCDDGPNCRRIKVGDHLRSRFYDFVVRRIIPPNGKDNPGWIDVELLEFNEPDVEELIALNSRHHIAPTDSYPDVAEIFGWSHMKACQPGSRGISITIPKIGYCARMATDQVGLSELELRRQDFFSTELRQNLSWQLHYGAIKDNQELPICGAVYRFEKDADRRFGVMTRLAAHPEGLKSQDTRKSFSVVWRLEMRTADNRAITILLHPPDSNRKLDHLREIWVLERGGPSVRQSEHPDLAKVIENPRSIKPRQISEGESIRTPHFHFQVRKIVPPSDNHYGWIDFELLK